jgi:hypothetical protein
LPIKLTIKRKGFEIETEGTLSSISKEVDALSEFVTDVMAKLGETLGEETIPSPNDVQPQIEESTKADISVTDIPVIKPSKRTSENLVALFSTPWGKTPRHVAEVMKALEVNAAPDQWSSVSVYLTRLVQQATLRRITKDGKWAYFKIPD